MVATVLYCIYLVYYSNVSLCLLSPVILIPTKNTLAIKKLQPRPEKGKKRCEIKRGRPRNAVDHIKNFDNDDSTFFAARVFLVGISLLF